MGDPEAYAGVVSPDLMPGSPVVVASVADGGGPVAADAGLLVAPLLMPGVAEAGWSMPRLMELPIPVMCCWGDGVPEERATVVEAPAEPELYDCRVPAMTSNISPVGVCSAIPGAVGDAYRAFDRSTGTFVQKGGAPIWVQYQFPCDFMIEKCEFQTHPAGDNSIKDYSIQCSPDGVDWTTVGSGTSANIKTLVEHTEFEDHDPVPYWRFNVLTGYVTYRTVIIVQFTGKTDDPAYDGLGY